MLNETMFEFMLNKLKIYYYYVHDSAHGKNSGVAEVN